MEQSRGAGGEEEERKGWGLGLRERVARGGGEWEEEMGGEAVHGGRGGGCGAVVQIGRAHV